MSAVLTAKQLQALEQRLQELRAELESALGAGKDSGAPVELDQTRVGRLSRVDAMQGQAMAKAAQARAQNDLTQVKSALRRLHEPDYGLCGECDEPIAWPRLQLNPGVRLCIECAQAREA